MENLIGLIGFGEAASSMARDFHAAGVQGLWAYDILSNSETHGASIRARAKQYGVTLARSIEELCAQTTYLLAFTSPASAVPVAQSAIPLLRAGQTYVDLNSTSPDMAVQMGKIPCADGVGVCDGAALGNVQKLGNKVPVVVCGTGAEAFRRDLTPYGMDIEVLDAPLGAASAMKMLKTVYSKGLQQLVLEYLLAAQSYGILEQMVNGVHNPMEGKTLAEYADEAMPRLFLHAQRRATEVANAVETVEQGGLEPVMTRAAQTGFERVAALHLTEQFPDIGQMNYQQIAQAVLPYMKKKSK